MHLTLLLVVGITAFGTAYSYAINNVADIKELAEKLQNRIMNKNRVEKESPMDHAYMDFYDALSAFSSNVEQLYTLTFKEIYGMSLDDFVGIPIGNHEFLHELAFNLSEIRTLRHFADVCESVFLGTLSEEDAYGILQVLSAIREPFEVIGSKFRVVYKKWYQWAKKTDFAYDFPLQHTSVEEVETLMEDTELFVQNADAILRGIPGYESIEHTPNATENHIIAMRLLEYRSFMAFYTGEGLDDDMGLQMWPMVQKWLSLMQSKQVKQAVFGVSRNIPWFLDLMEKYGILGLQPQYQYGPVY